MYVGELHASTRWRHFVKTVLELRPYGFMTRVDFVLGDS